MSTWDATRKMARDDLKEKPATVVKRLERHEIKDHFPDTWEEVLAGSPGVMVFAIVRFDNGRTFLMAANDLEALSD